MGPTNQRLLHLYNADRDLRQAEDNLDRATRGVRVQKKRAELALASLQETHMSLQRLKAKQMELEGDLKARDEHMEHLRLQQQEASNPRQYQALLQQLNTQKAEQSRIEEEGLSQTDQIKALETQEVEQRDQANAEAETARQLESEIEDKTKELQAVIDDLAPKRQAAASEVKSDLLTTYERLADNYEGEALAPIGHIEGKEERYYCTACNMELVVDVYNRLKLRDEVATCPGCGRILYIPEELTPEMAIRQKKTAKRASRAKKGAKKAVKKDRKGVPVKVKRVLTTAAAESLRQNKEEGADAAEVEVKIVGVLTIAGPFSVASKDDFAKLVAAKLQSEDIEIDYVVRHVGEDLEPQVASEAPAEEAAEPVEA
jgi:predicted  nucleic acid-binding Zn-ribbon protein